MNDILKTNQLDQQQILENRNNKNINIFLVESLTRDETLCYFLVLVL